MAGRALRILLVEGHPDTALALQFYLEYLGHQVATASSMAAALKKLAAEEFDFLLCEISLPDGTGWELLRLASHAPRFAVAMSGLGMNADSSHSHAAGYRHHLLKPFRPEELERLLEEAGQSR